MSSPKILTFDCYGTLIDWKTGVLNAIQPWITDINSDQFFETWWRVDRRLTCHEPYRCYRDILMQDFIESCQSVNISLSNRDAERLADGLGNWSPFPDAPSALARFKHMGFQLGILSNIDNDLLDRSVAHLGVDVDLRITAENIRSYKPAPRHFETLLESTGLNPNQILHIAASRFVDIDPASKLGIPTMWVRRSEPDADHDVHPDYTVETLADAVPILEYMRKAPE